MVNKDKTRVANIIEKFKDLEYYIPYLNMELWTDWSGELHYDTDIDKSKTIAFENLDEFEKVINDLLYEKSKE